MVVGGDSYTLTLVSGGGDDFCFDLSVTASNLRRWLHVVVLSALFSCTSTFDMPLLY